MKAWLIINKYLISDSFLNLKQLLMISAKKHNIDLIEINNIDIIKLLNENKYEKPDFVLFWNKDVKLAQFIENLGIKVYNSSESIRLCDDKALTYIALNFAKIKQPKTFFSPLLYYNDLTEDNEILDYIINELKFPLIIKECSGSFGNQVTLLNNKEDVIKKIKSLKNCPYIIQEFIKTSFAKDIRIYIVGNKYIASMKRQNFNGDFRANIEMGGIGEIYYPNEKQIDICIKAANALKLDFCGIDLLFGENDEPILCEVNSNAYFNTLDKVANIKIEDYIFEHIIKSQ